jgi:multidrug efflux pump subunit AcrA (membrane-fusion protein)
MSNDHTVDGRAKGQVEQELPVKILVHLSAFNAAIKNDSGGFAPGLDEPLAKESREFLIDLTFRNKLTHDTASGAAGAQGLSTVPQELFHMAAVNRLRIFVSVPEVDSEAVQNGAKVPLTLDEFPGETFQGTIVRNSDAIDLNSRTLNVEVDIDNRDGRMKPGAYVFVHFTLPDNSKRATHSLIIPANTLLFRSEGLQVGVVRANNAELVPITIGRDYGSTVEVINGTQANRSGDRQSLGLAHYRNPRSH